MYFFVKLSSLVIFISLVSSWKMKKKSGAVDLGFKKPLKKIDGRDVDTFFSSDVRAFAQF